MLIEKLNWRYATKKMDPAKAVSEDKIDRILEAARLAPTSSGLQPFEIIVVKDKQTREKIQAIAWNQSRYPGRSLTFVCGICIRPERPPKRSLISSTQKASTTARNPFG